MLLIIMRARQAAGGGRLLSPKEVVARARKQGLIIAADTLARRARLGRGLRERSAGSAVVPHAVREGWRGGFLFPESAFFKVIASVPAQAVPPEGSVTMHVLEKAAKQSGLKIDWADIRHKFNRIAQGKEASGASLNSAEGGLARGPTMVRESGLLAQV